jgi:sec-independent protein translocase protein TatA
MIENTVPMFVPVGPEMIVIALVLVLLFGANKIPKLARSTGQAMGEFKKGREELEEELQQEITDE